MKRLLYLLLVLLMLQGMCMSAYATQSVSNERLRVMITEAIHGWKTELDLTGMGLHEDTVTAVVETICNDPELFWFNKYSWNLWRYPDTGITAKLEFQYYEEFKSSDVQVFEAAVDKALTCVLPGMDDLQKALVLHDYLASHVEYDYKNYLNDTETLIHGLRCVGAGNGCLRRIC